MKIIRFIDPQGTECLGTPTEDGHANLLTGNPLEPGEYTSEIRRIETALPPLAVPNLFCIGLNYKAHAKEAGMDLPAHPPLFMKPTTTLSSHNSPIVIPAACDRGDEVDYEAELAVIIGKTARDVSVESALDHVGGYSCANDVSARKWQMHAGAGQWIRGKSFDGFCPLGPVMVTADEIPDPQTLAVRCMLNGEVMQDGHTSDMVFSVAEIIAFLSRDTTLLPGTVILTGTPPGVGFARKPPVYLKPGDHVEVEIEGIGKLSNPVIGA